MVKTLPLVDVLPIRARTILLSMASGGCADYLMTGGKQDLLALKKYDTTLIVSVGGFLAQLAEHTVPTKAPIPIAGC